MLAWYVNDHVTQRWLATVDAGRHWRPVTIRAIATVPIGWLVLGLEPGVVPTKSVLTADPVTGDIAMLAQPTNMTAAHAVAGLPPAAGLWLAGTADAGNERLKNNIVGASHNGGVTWHRQSFPDLMDVTGQPAGPVVATYDGQRAYALGQSGVMLLIYHTTDGGATWQRTTAQLRIGSDPTVIRAAVQADGRLTLQLGDLASEHPTMYQSTDSGQTLRQITIGPGAAAVPVPGGYVQSDWPNTSGAWLSVDATTWTYSGPPALP